MRPPGQSSELERRRYLAVHRLLEGDPLDDVADFLEVDARSVRRWWETFARLGWQGLAAHRGAGRPRKLSPTQEKIVVRWLQDDPTEFGFATQLWTCQRLCKLIREEWGIQLHPRYLPSWLRERGFTPQKPERVPRERDPELIERWLATEWPRIKKKRLCGKPTSF